uniref:serine/threonine-protein kinase 32C-like n=1 Tax=Halichoerus grypus TaxID=9711 RepID=UPI001658FA7B
PEVGAPFPCLTLEILVVRPPWGTLAPGQAVSSVHQDRAGPGHRLTWAPFQLLTVDPKHRVSSLQDMQAAPSLAGVLWQDLSEKKVAPGFVPNKGRLHCDPTFELEEMILESRPLHKKKKRLAKNRSRDSSRDSSQSENDYLQDCLDAIQQDFVIFNREKLKKSQDPASEPLPAPEAGDAAEDREGARPAGPMCGSICPSRLTES